MIMFELINDDDDDETVESGNVSLATTFRVGHEFLNK